MKPAMAGAVAYLAGRKTVGIHVTHSSGVDNDEHPAGCETSPLQLDYQHAVEMVVYPHRGRSVLWEDSCAVLAQTDSRDTRGLQHSMVGCSAPAVGS